MALCVSTLVVLAPRHRQKKSHFKGAALSESEAASEAQKAQEVQKQHALAIQAKESTSIPADGTDNLVESQGEMHEGKRYDLVLQIDVADDADPLPLPINRGDDRRQVASDFVALHQLPESYIDRIVDFINLVLG